MASKKTEASRYCGCLLGGRKAKDVSIPSGAFGREDGIVSQILFLEEGNRLRTILTTNTTEACLLARLKYRGVAHLVERVTTFCRDRALGGRGFEVLWRTGTSKEQVREALCGL